MHKLVAAAALATLFAVSGAIAQTPPASSPSKGTSDAGTTAKTQAKTKSKSTAAKKPRSAASIECSRQADAKGLKGKPRQKFRRSCLKSAKKKAA